MTTNYNPEKGLSQLFIYYKKTESRCQSSDEMINILFPVSV